MPVPESVCAVEPDKDKIPEPEIVPLFVRLPWTVSVLEVAIKTVSPEATKKSSWAKVWKAVAENKIDRTNDLFMERKLAK